jgi:hypothetical protein
MFTRKFYEHLLEQAKQDLSQAHLTQHFAIADAYLKNTDYKTTGTAAWSAWKLPDTLCYQNGHVSGKKYWVSGMEQCSDVVVAVKHAEQTLIVVVPTQHLQVQTIFTQGMEDTRTVHFTCENAPAQVIQYQDNHHNIGYATTIGFITNHLGLAMAAYNDIDLYTGHAFAYDKAKIKLDIEILYQLWQNLIDQVLDINWNKINLIYAFAKKALTQTAQLTLEITGSGLYNIENASNQRYRDMLIYTTHMKNTPAALTNIAQWSF